MKTSIDPGWARYYSLCQCSRHRSFWGNRSAEGPMHLFGRTAKAITPVAYFEIGEQRALA
jgi:hypothetical protein